MPVTKSAAKAMRSSSRKRAINLATIKKYKNAIKEVRKAATAGKKDEGIKNLSIAYKQIDRAAKKNIIHKKKASRLKSRLSKAVGRSGK